MALPSDARSPCRRQGDNVLVSRRGPPAPRDALGGGGDDDGGPGRRDGVVEGVLVDRSRRWLRIGVADAAAAEVGAGSEAGY